MKQVLVEFTVDQAVALYEEIERLGIQNNVEAKQALVFDFVKNGKCVSAWETGRTKEQIVEDLKKNYGKILDLTSENQSKNNDKNLFQKKI